MKQAGTKSKAAKRLNRGPIASVFAALLLTVSPLSPAFAQAPSPAAIEQSKPISASIDAQFKAGDVEGARRRALETSHMFEAQGEPWLAASYIVAAAEFDIRAGNAARIDAEIAPRMEELLNVLDSSDASRGDTLVDVVMAAKGALGQAQAHDRIAALYEERIRKRSGENSEAGLSARLRIGYSLMQAGRADEGYKRLRDVLLAASRTDHLAYTMISYAEVADRLHHNGMNEQAAQIFADGEQTRAARADSREAADFLLASARFKVAVGDLNPAISTFSLAVGMFEKLYGAESREFLNAYDYFGVALIGMGQLGTGSFIARENYDKALKLLGPDDPLTWRVANNLADALRTTGSPSRALELDKMLLEKRTAQYGQNHFNVLVTANNTAQDYLDLGDYAQALKLFQLCREIATGTNDAQNAAVTDVWIEYTRLASGDIKMDAQSVATLDGVTTSSDYPLILSMKAASLLAGHFQETGDEQQATKYLKLAYDMSASENGIGHPATFAAELALANQKAKDEPQQAVTDFAKLDVAMLAWIGPQVSFSASREFGESARAQADDMLYDYARLAERDPAIVSAFADAIRRWPSLEDGKRDAVRKLMLATDPNDQAMQDDLKESIRLSFIIQELFSAGGPDSKEVGYPLFDRLKALDEATNRRAAEYGLDSSVLEKPLPAGKDLLAADQAQVQYFITRKWKADRDQADPFVDTRLYAVVSRKDMEPKLFQLGDPRGILSSAEVEQVASLRSARSERGAMPLVTVNATFAGLYEKLMAPLEGQLAGANTVFVVPDGQLFAVPFSLLQDKNGKLLEERMTIRLLTRPESILGIKADQKLAKDGQAVLAGGIDYANGAERGAPPLPGARREVEEVGALLNNDAYKTDLLTGTDVTEPALREKMEAATIAHLATHGAYASARSGGVEGVDALWQSDVILSRSGDKRAMKRDASDGRLYAFELMLWNLSKLDLLVLSACETGRGEETFVGGLRGLPTAINIAGAKRSLLTLWPVDDAGTEQFMVRFYEHLIGGETYPQALRQTRLDAIAGQLPAAEDPLVWAAFVMFEN